MLGWLIVALLVVAVWFLLTAAVFAACAMSGRCAANEPDPLALHLGEDGL